MIYTEDRETFEAQMFRPPYLARMMEATGKYAGKMVDKDRDAFFAAAVDAFWALRNEICSSTAGILFVWKKALEAAAVSRERWMVWNQLELRYEWVLGRRLGK